MRLLLDTHIFLWFISGDSRLTQTVKDAIQEPENDVYLSAVSIWEAIIKYRLGKLPLPKPAHTYLPEQRRRHRIASLPVIEEDVIQLGDLPSLHRDPFDRLLICQAQTQDLTLVTVDGNILAYPNTATLSG